MLNIKAQYGATAAGIAFATGCSVEFAQEFLDNEAKLFPESIAYRAVVRNSVEYTGSLPDGIHREMLPQHLQGNLQDPLRAPLALSLREAASMPRS